MYKVAHRRKNQKKKTVAWLIGLAILIGLSLWGVATVRAMMQPKTVIKQSRTVKTHVDYSQKTKHYDETDFSLDLPTTWQQLPPPENSPYKMFIWQSADRVTNGQRIEIYEDTIPLKYAVNRVLIVHGETDHMTLGGSASDNCAQYTTGKSAPNEFGAPAKWQNVDFLCDMANDARDTIGTSSSDGLNTVILRSQSSGLSHKFFFTYTDHSTNPDYTVFYDALNSLRMN
jgi:hypothetical protein